MAYESDWLFLREALPVLREYLLSSDLYWPLRTRAQAGARLPQLTIGSLALSLARLGALGLTGQPAAELAELSGRVDAVRQEWRANWGIKAGREFRSRLNLWQQYLRELRADPQHHAPAYASEVRVRAILGLLRSEAGGLPADQEEQLAMLDQILRGLTRPGPFLWEVELSGGFSQESFWFLYVAFPGQIR
jgi:hypothetical protein